MEPSRPRSMRLRGGVASSVGCLLPAACCLLALGCNSGKALERDLIQRELRLQEDEIYRLEDYLEEYQRKVCRLRAENLQLQQQLGETASGGSHPAPTRADREESSRLDLPDEPTSRSNNADPPPPALPEIDFGTPATESIDAPIDTPPAPADIRPSPPRTTPASDEPPPFVPSAEPPTEAPIDAGSFVPEEISAPSGPIEPTAYTSHEPNTPEPGGLTPLRAGEAVLEATPPIASVAVVGRPGPPEPTGQPTLVVLATPKTYGGEPVVFAGEAAVMLRDPAAAPGERTVARWDFTPLEVAEASGLTGRSADIELLIALPSEPPRDRPIELWVRLVDDQGNKTLGVHRLTPPIREQQPATARGPIEAAPRSHETRAPVDEPPVDRPAIDPLADEPAAIAPIVLAAPGPFADEPPPKLMRLAAPIEITPAPPRRRRPEPAHVPGWNNPAASPALPSAPPRVSAPPSWRGAAAAPTESTIRVVSHEEAVAPRR